MDTQQILETQKRIIDAVLQFATEAVIVVDTNQNITHFNKSAEALTQYSIVDTLNKNVGEFLKLSNEQGLINIDAMCPRGELDMHGIIYEAQNLMLKTKNGEDQIVNVRAIKVSGGSQVNVGSIIFIENTFEKTDLERTKLDFVSMAEHVLRTPITIIRGNLSRALEDHTLSKLNESEVGYLNSSFEGTTELLELIENLLNIVEIRKGDFKLDKSAINLETLVMNMLEDFKIMAQEKNLRLVFIPPLHKVPMVEAEVGKIKIVLQNLLENAIKYTEEGKIELILEPKDNFVQVTIIDTGRGIPEENINQLFTKFYRVKKALEMEYGMGLGLYMSKKIIEAHGGNIWVESKQGQGSTFRFTLPISVKGD